MRIIKKSKRTGEISSTTLGNKSGSGDRSEKTVQKDSLGDQMSNSDHHQLGCQGKSVKNRKIRDVKRLSAKEQYAHLFAKGIRVLAMREHSVQEITDKLSKASDDLNIVYTVVEDLLSENYLSDERFAESYTRSRRNRGFGPSKIRSELFAKGIDSSLIDQYLQENSAIWLENAENQYHKKYGDEPVKDYNTWAKRARFMQSRGFSMEHIQVTLPSVDFD